MDVDLVAIRLAAAVRQRVSKLEAFDYVPDVITPPCFCVAEIDIVPHRTMRNAVNEATFTCRVFTARSDDQAGQQLLRSFSRGEGVTSVLAAIEYDKTLGGACDSLMVKGISGNRLFVYGEQRHYGSEFAVFVVGDGS